MSPFFLLLVISLTVAQVALSKKYAFLPLVVAGLHLGNGEILPELTTARLLIILGLGRAVIGGFLVIPSRKSALDVLFLVFCSFALLSTVGHKADAYIPSPFNARVGMVLNILGTYLYGRSYLPDLATFCRYTFLLPLILIPLAVCMLIEQRTQKNLYFILGAAREEALVRQDKIRAQGPFRHPILAGCAGATALPFAYLLWRRRYRTAALIGAAACMGVTVASASSGPLAAVVVTVGSIGFWRWRQHLGKAIWAVIILSALYNVIKGRGPWYIMASLDLVGGSTGWHRAKLIDQGFNYLGEWWLWGSDYTRHWMASGVSWNPNMVDLTNYYLHLGVTGGLSLTLCLFGFLVIAFRLLNQRMSDMRLHDDSDEIILWCAAASLATHAISFVSISYFDQMYIYFYLLLGAIPGLAASTSTLSNLKPAIAVPTSEPIPVKPLRYYS